MSLESLIKMQSGGARSIEDLNTPRPGGVSQGTVLVILDVTKEIWVAPVHWALGNVARRGDNLRVVGIVTHVCNPMGFTTRVTKDSWVGSSGLLLQHELATKRESLENIPQVKEWCDKAGVQLELDVKAGFVTKVIVVDVAKATGAYHVVLDKSMKGDRKYFVENLTCFVSRARQSGGVETIRSFSVSKQLPPLVPATPKIGSNNHQPTPPGAGFSVVSLGSHGSVSSSDGFLTQDSDPFSGAPSTGDSFTDEPSSRPSIPLRASYSDSGSQKGNAIPETGYNAINRKPALRKWLAEGADIVPQQENGAFNNGNKISSMVEQPPKRTSPLMSPQQISPPPTLEKHVNAVAPLPLSQSFHKTVWIWTRSKEVMRSAVQVGWTTFIFTPDTKYMAPQWTSIESIKPVYLEGGRFLNQESKQVALLGQVYSGEQLDYLPAMMGGTDIVVINDLDWQVIPPEDIVAAFQGRRTQLFATANSAADSQVYLEALEVGTDGVVLHTENVSEITALRDYLTAKNTTKALALTEPPIKEVGELQLAVTKPTSMARSENGSDRVSSSPVRSLHRQDSSRSSDANSLNRIGSSPRLGDSSPRNPGSGCKLVNATVKSVVSVGEGDRVSVDLCNLLNPGEALLVGSFSKGMFLVHSEVQDNNTSRRSFRVNAGPVHAYTGMAGGCIMYLSELDTGGQVLAMDAHGNQRTVLVGRVLIETKPLVLVQVEAEGQSFSVMLQDADSVRLVVPAEKQRPGCEAIPVTKLQPGDTVLLSMED